MNNATSTSTTETNATPRQAPRVLDVGNCGPDFGSIRRTLEKHFLAVVDQAHTGDEAIEKLVSQSYDLVLINRKLDIDYSDGIEIVKRIKKDSRITQVPVMLVTNYVEHQAAAVAEGALPGFGKLQLDSPQTIERLSAVFTKRA